MFKLCRVFGTALRQPSFEKKYVSTAFSQNFYKSDLSLDKLYSSSRQQLYTPEPPKNIDGKFSGYIPINQLKITYSRSSGPGGQHVNCVNTKVDLRFKLSEAKWIPENTRQKLVDGLKNKINDEGYFVIKSDLTRSQQMNLADALEKLRTLIRDYEKEPAPVKEESLEKLRRIREKSARERLSIKRQRSQVKNDRQGPAVANI